MLTCPCDLYPLTPHFYIVKLGFTGVYIFFLIFALKHRLWVLVRTASLRVLTCTHNQCFEQKLVKHHNFSSENYRFYSREISLYIAWACLRNEGGKSILRAQPRPQLLKWFKIFSF